MPWRAKMSPNSLSACTRPASSLRLDPDGGGGHPGAAPRRHPRPVRRQKRDRRQLAEVLARIDPCTTLFVVASKTGVEDGGQDKVGQRPARTMRLRWRRRRSFACPEIGRRQWEGSEHLVWAWVALLAFGGARPPGWQLQVEVTMIHLSCLRSSGLTAANRMLLYRTETLENGPLGGRQMLSQTRYSLPCPPRLNLHLLLPVMCCECESCSCAVTISPCCTVVAWTISRC